MGLSVLEVQKEYTLPSRTPMTVASTMSVLTELTRRTQDALLGRCSIQPSNSVTCQPMSMVSPPSTPCSFLCYFLATHG